MTTSRIPVFAMKRNEIQYDKHLKQLELIAQEKRAPIANDKLSSEITKMRLNTLKNHHIEKLENIDKDNQVLLDRLLEISTKKNPIMRQSRSETSIKKTLNSGFRKRQLQKITEENVALAKRLLSQQSCVDSRKLEKEFKKHQDILKNCMKVQSPQIVKLPPIKRDFMNKSESKAALEQESITVREEKTERVEKVQKNERSEKTQKNGKNGKTNKPVEKTDKPMEKTEKTMEKTDKPVEKTDKPVEKIDKTVEKTEKPLENTENVVDKTDKGLEATEKGIDKTNKGTEKSDQPVDKTNKPMDKTNEPGLSEKAKVVEEKQAVNDKDNDLKKINDIDIKKCKIFLFIVQKTIYPN